MARVVHFEILADDPERMAAFYNEALGWQVQTWGPTESYWLVTTGPTGEPGINGGITARHWSQPVINTVEVESLAEVTTRIEQCGGKRVHGPTAVPGVGTHAYFIDPEGHMFGAMQPLRAPDER